MSHLSDVQVYPIFLVRDPRGVVWSAMKKPGSPERDRGDSKMLRFLRCLFSWNVVNYLTLIVARFFLKEYLVVRYEDFANNPVETLRSVQKYIDEDLGNVIRKLQGNKPIDIAHNLGGNRLRFKRSIRNINLDKSWCSDMPFFYSSLATLFSFPLIWFFKRK